MSALTVYLPLQAAFPSLRNAMSWTFEEVAQGEMRKCLITEQVHTQGNNNDSNNYDSDTFRNVLFPVLKSC